MNLLQYINSWDTDIVNWLSNSPNYRFPIVTCDKKIIVFMPEPFMGDPDNCSFVIVNLNPGAGVWHSCINQKAVTGTLINKVATLGYSKAIMDFPYLQDETTVRLTNWDDSPGKKWWKSKERWIKHIIKMYEPSYNTGDTIPHDLYPFAMEMFAWHTTKWPKSLNKQMKAGGAYGATIKDEVFAPLYEAIQKSKFKFAFCVGKPIGDIISSFGLFVKTNSLPIQPLPTKKRFYDVYSDGKGCHIVNTWAQGGNTYPSADFEKEEEMLFRKKQIIP